MISKLVAVLAIVAGVVYTQTTTLNLPVTQDFAVANNGFSGAQISRPDSLSFFNNGFQSSVAYFGIDLSPLSSYDTSTISSATLTFTNFTLSRDTSANIAITLLNYGQVFDESTVNLNTQPTSQGTLGTVNFNSATGVATISVVNQLKSAQTAGGLFGFRVDPPGGPVSIASHRVNPNAVYIAVVFGGAAPSTTTTTGAPTVPSAPSTAAPGAPSTAAPVVTTTTTTAAPAPVPGAPSTARVTTTTTTRAPVPAPPGSTTTTTTARPTSGPTSTFGPSASPTVPAASNPSTTEAPRSSANKMSALLLCIVPLAIALLL